MTRMCENDAGRMPTTTSSSCFPRLRLVNPPRRWRQGPWRGSTAVAVARCAVWIPPVAHCEGDGSLTNE